MTSKPDQILNATRDLIFEQGLQSTSMSQITKRAGVGMGTVYNYFGRKEDLINGLYCELKMAMSEYILRDYDANQPIIERFLQVCRHLAYYGLRYPKEFQIIEQLTYSPYIHTTLKERDFGLHSEFEQLFADAQAQRMIKDLPFEMVGQLIYGALSGLVRGHVAGKLVLDDDLIEKGVEACWDAVKR